VDARVKPAHDESKLVAWYKLHAMHDPGPDDDPHDEIVRLEEQIEELAERIEGCRKFILAARVAIPAGGALVLAIFVGLIQFDLLLMAVGITALLGGFVLLGSNSTTAKQAASEMREAEAARAALIGRIQLRAIPGGRTLH
jgi:undecaprenyl pyrophosphate phosphatase UppP